MCTSEEIYQTVMNEQLNGIWAQFRDGLAEWHGPYIADGRQYFVNSVTNISSWEDPRIEAQYLCELQSALLQKLQTVIPPQEPMDGGYGDDDDHSRPGTPDFAGGGISPRVHGNDAGFETAGGSSPGVHGLEQTTELARLRMAMAEKLQGIDFIGEAERDRAKMTKNMTDGINLLRKKRSASHIRWFLSLIIGPMLSCSVF